MTDNLYAAPESDVEHHSGKVENGSIIWGSGRLSVMSFIVHNILLNCIYIPVALGLALITGVSPTTSDTQLGLFSGNPSIMWVPNLIAVTLVFWIGTCLTIKRLHDRNLSGWWVILFTIPFVMIGALSYFGIDAGLFSLVSVALIVVLFIPGKDEPNRFGSWRKTRRWEKIVLIVCLVLFVLVALLGQRLGFT